MSAYSPRTWSTARLSLAFTLDQVVDGLAGLAPLDALLVLAVNQANIAPLTRDPEARRAYGDLEHAAPDAVRRPASVNAIANSLGVPFETTRRRLKRLETDGVCAFVPHAGVVIPESFLTSPPYLASVTAAHQRLVGFYGALTDAGLLDPLPPPHYDVEDGVPLRGAARLMSDYLLRAVDGLLRETADVVSAITLLAIVADSIEGADWTPAAPGEPAAPAVFPPVSVAELSRRLRLPSETTRRHVGVLVDMGLCERWTRGVAASPAFLAHPRFQTLAEEHAASVQRLFAGLAERGVVAAWELMGAGLAPRRRA